MKSFETIKLELNDYQLWQKSNQNKRFSLYDYIHGLLQVGELSSDICIAFLKLFRPDFIMINGNIFLLEEYSQKKYNDLNNNGYSGRELEYWLNLLNIDCYFETPKEDFNIDKCLVFAHELTKAWSVKLHQEFSEREFEVICIDETGDNDEKEIYITFFQK